MTSRLGLSLLTIFMAVVLLVPIAGAAGDEHSFVGTKDCKKCHIREWKSWSQTKMANAFELLKPGVRAEAKEKAGLDPDKDYTADPACVRCHVTGFQKDGGFVDVETTPELVGVGCEACHGPGGTYTQDGYMTLKNKEFKRDELVKVGLVAQVTAEQCVQCHNEDSPFVGPDYVFDFEARKEQGTHEKFPLKYEH
jgi:cytochrome c553